MKEPPDKRKTLDLPEIGRRTATPHRFRPAAIMFSLLLLVAIGASIYWVVVGRLSWRKTDVLAVSLREPSGIAFHPSRSTLFVVGDEGTIAEVSPDGLVLRKRPLAGADFEGLTVDPTSGFLYALIESENTIVEIEPEHLDIKRRFGIDGRFGGQNLIPPGAKGLEGIAFAPDANHAEGGRFFVVNRGPAAKGSRPGPGNSFLAELAVPLRSSSAEKPGATIVGAVSCTLGDLSGVTWSTRAGRLVVISDRHDVYVEMGPDGRVYKRFPLAGKTQEGIAFDLEGNAYIAQDFGGILRFLPR